MADPVNFTRLAANRIARVVRQVEGGNRDGNGPVWDRPWPSGSGCRTIFRVATYTGVWNMETLKTVTFYNQPATPNTVTATNLFVDLPDRSGTAVVGIVREKGDWYLWTWQEFTATAVFATLTQSQTVITSLQLTAALNTSNCAITVSSTPGTMTVTFVQNTYTCVYVKLEP